MRDHAAVRRFARVQGNSMTPRPRLSALLGSVLVLAVLTATLAVVRPGVATPADSARPLAFDVAELAPGARRPASGSKCWLPRARFEHPVLSAPSAASPSPRAFAGTLDAPSPRPAAELAELTPKQQKKVDKLDAKLQKKQLALLQLEQDLVTAETARAASVIALSLAQSLLDSAEQQLADALAMPASTAQEIAARNLAVKDAKFALKSAKKSFKASKKANKKAVKKVAKLEKKIAKNETQQSKIATKLEELDPGHFASATSGPVLAALANASQVVLTWTDIVGAESYRLYWSTEPDVSPETGNAVHDVDSPHVTNGLPLGFTLHAVVVALVDGEESAPSNPIEVTTTDAEGGDSDGGEPDDDDDEPGDGGDGEPGGGDDAPSPYDPPWATVAPLQTIVLDHDPELSDTQNGTALKNAVSALQAGDMLVVGGGTWSIPSKFSPVFDGTAQAPVWIVAAEGETPIITRPDASQNTINPEGSYGVMRGLEVTGGSIGVRVGAASNLWIDQCEIHHTPEAALVINSADTDHLYITRNHIHHISLGTNGTGEGMYLGANNSQYVMSESIIALNHVHDTGGSQGDGIELKQGSWGNWIVENDVHDTKFPCVIAYGTDGNPVNVIERNRLVGSDAQTLQVQGEAVVRNNLIIDGDTGFQSHDHQGQTRDLVFVHNTILNAGKGAHLGNWGGRAGMVFANNVVYSESAQSVTFGAGSAGVAWAGNVLRGSTSGAPAGGVVAGNGLSDFVDAAWNGSAQDVTPAPGSPILGAGAAGHAVDEDLSGEQRTGALESGCIDAD